MFTLDTPTPAKLTSVNCRSELHGKENVPAVDLKFTFDAQNIILSEFDDWLLTALYYRNDKPSEAEAAQGSLDGVEVVSDVPNLRMPLLASPIKWTKEYTGYELTIDMGLGGKSNVVLGDCAVNNVAFEPKEGGTVAVTVRVQCTKGLTEKVLGKLATLVQHDVAILLSPPEVTEPQQPIEPASGGDNWPFPKTPEQALAETQG
jgi:hypothetical protein